MNFTTQRRNVRNALFGGAALVSMLGGMIFTNSNPVQAKNRGNQFTIVLEEVGKIPVWSRTQGRGSNPTAIQVVNQTDLDLSYGLNYGGGYKDIELAAKRTATNFGQTELAAAAWDKDLRQPHIQLNIKLLKPGYQYAFKRM
ncbi:hypothetical protein [Lyngbya aestuarii]|uniref:hypothetical protein n=1 Tax=Lyngbya aestuarii TaxID=118322 RepID=UPI00403E2444